MANYNTQLQSNNTDLQTILNTINKLPNAGGSGIELPSLTNEGTASNLLNNKQLIDGNGDVIIGTMPNNGTIISTMDGIDIKSVIIPSGYTSGGTVSLDNTIDNEVNVQTELLYQIVDALEGKQVEQFENEDKIINRTISNYTNNRISSIGNYAFYDCRQLTTVSFPAATTIGNNAFANCFSLTTVNFPACTTIGSSAFSGCVVLTDVSFPTCINISSGAFSTCKKLTTVSFPACTNIGSSAFVFCSKLTTASFPTCTNIGGNAFGKCLSLTTIYFPVVTIIGSSAFSDCYSLTTASFPFVQDIYSSAFQYCYNLSQLYLTGSSLCTLVNSNAFKSTPYAGYSTSFSGTPYIYVPTSLLTSYQTATNWAYFSSKFIGI